VRQIADFVGAPSADFPPIVGGDFNATPAPTSTEARFVKGQDAFDQRSYHLVDAFYVAHPDLPDFTWSNTNPRSSEFLSGPAHRLHLRRNARGL
jgi:hypothetical protein